MDKLVRWSSIFYLKLCQTCQLKYPQFCPKHPITLKNRIQYVYYVLFFRHVFPTLYQWHQHILQPFTISKSFGAISRSTAAATTTKGTTTATTVYKFPLPTTTTTAATGTTIPTIRELAADIQLPGLSKQSYIPTGLSAHSVPTGKCIYTSLYT